MQPFNTSVQANNPLKTSNFASMGLKTLQNLLNSILALCFYAPPF